MKELRTGIYKVLILKILLTKGPLHGYGIRKAIEELSQGRLTPSESTIYEALKKLEKLGLVESFWAQSPLAAPMRKYYSARRDVELLIKRAIEELKCLMDILMR